MTLKMGGGKLEVQWIQKKQLIYGFSIKNYTRILNSNPI